MVVLDVWLPPDERVSVTGRGLDPEGQFMVNNAALPAGALPPALCNILRAAALCNTSSISRPDPSADWVGVGDPTEVALTVRDDDHDDDDDDATPGVNWPAGD
jgi:magnesium-transporting ATPase (P-type)